MLFSSLSVERDEDNLLCEENESVSSSHQGIDKVLQNVSSAMSQMSSSMLSMEKAMKWLADTPENHATPPKRRRKSPETSLMSDSRDSDPAKSDSKEPLARQMVTRQNGAVVSLRTHCSMKLLGTSKLTQNLLRNWQISSISNGVLR